MVQFHPLRVSEIRKTTRDAVVLTLEPDSGDFSFTPGQYLTFRRDFDGQEIRRSYSICSAPEDGLLQVGIKRVEGGAFSNWANRDLAVGDVVQAMPPMGRFHAGKDETQDHILAVAAGSGITPVLSILKTALTQDESTQVTLVYANRNPNTIMFRETLEDLKNTYMERLNVIHILSGDAQEIDLFHGRLDAEKCAGLFRHWIDVQSVSVAYICGPEEMMQTVSGALQDHGLPKAQIRFELFASAQPGRLPLRVQSDEALSKGTEGRVTLGGETRALIVAPGQSLLEAAIAADIDAPFACKAGVCSTCKAKVERGETQMIANHALEDYEVEAGFVLTCQCYPVGDADVQWNYDEAGH